MTPEARIKGKQPSVAKRATAVHVAAFVVRRGAVLLVQRTDRQPAMPGLWEIPGGKLMPGESLCDGCAREVWEETNLRVLPLGPASVMEYWKRSPYVVTHCVQINYVGVPQFATNHVVRLGPEHQRFDWVPWHSCGAGLVSEELAHAWQQALPQLGVIADIESSRGSKPELWNSRQSIPNLTLQQQ